MSILVELLTITDKSPIQHKILTKRLRYNEIICNHMKNLTNALHESSKSL